MKLFDFIGAKGYEILHAVDPQGWDALGDLDGSPRGQTWVPQRVRRVRPSKREGFRPSDAPYACMSNILIFRRSAVDALRDILDAHGELLPLEDEEAVELYAYNPRVLDAFDQVLSKGPRDEYGKLEAATHAVFIPSIVDQADIFKAGSGRAKEIYLSERFLQRWKKAKLKGLDFFLAWDSDLPPDQQPNVAKSKPVKMSTIK